MKKNISINISGIIFHIEEDGYDQLKNYLESINKYFDSFEDSKEIIEDIENRIAEIFLSKLTDGNQVVAKSDVESLISTMGSISDFEAAEEIEDFGQKTVEEESSFFESDNSTQEERTESAQGKQKKLQRDTKRKLLGGVAAGIAHYFGIDPLWVRLIIVVLFFNLFIWFPISGAILVAYVILWIVLPPSEVLEEDKNLKKMFRNSEKRVLGGVASGLGAYFGADINLIRILFVITALLGGTGLVLYIILWIITPEAKSITDKIQMQGEPVTLSNIESSVKKSLDVEETAEESVFVKILLFPFRLIATLFKGLGKLFGPVMLFIVEFIRVIAGLVILLVGISFLVAFSVTLSVILGIFAGGDFFYLSNDIPIDLIKASIPPFTVLAAYGAVLIPSIALTILGATIVAKRKVLNATAGWSLFGFWVLSLFALATTVPMLVRNFRTDAEYREVQTFSLQGKTAVLGLEEVGLGEFDATTLKIRGHDEKDYKLVKNFYARGRSRQNAIENAKMVSYFVKQNDSIITFDSNIQFNDDAEYRMQELEMTLYVPYNTKFEMSPRISKILRSTLYYNDYNSRDLDDNIWMIVEREGLMCLTCDEDNFTNNFNSSSRFNEDILSFTEENFDEILVGDDFEVEIEMADTYEIKIIGLERDLDHVDVELDENRLEIDLDRYIRRNHSRIKVEIKTPRLEGVILRGGSISTIRGFENAEFDIRMSGAASAEIDITTEKLLITQTGSSNLIVTGSGHELDIELTGTSKFNGYEFTVDNAEVSAKGASNASIFATENLEVEAGGASKVKYKGSPQVNEDVSGVGEVLKE